MFKKLSCLMLTFAMLLSLVACGGNTSNGTDTNGNTADIGNSDSSKTDTSVTTPTPQANDTLIGFGGGASGGGFYTFSNILALALTDADIGNFSAQATTGGTNNCLLMQQGTLGIALINSVDATEAYTGSNEAFAEKPYENLRAILQWDTAYSVLAVSDKIEKFEDLKGKKVVVGAPGSGEYNHFNRIFSVASFGWDDIEAQMVGSSEGKDALLNGLADCQMNVGGIPYAALTEVCLSGKVHIISYPEDVLHGLCDVEGAPYNRGVIPAGTYEGQTEDVNCLAMPYGLFCDADALTDEQVYKICEYMFENEEALVAQYASVKLDEAQSADAFASVPYHPGAIKYYQDKGLM